MGNSYAPEKDKGSCMHNSSIKIALNVTLYNWVQKQRMYLTTHRKSSERTNLKGCRDMAVLNLQILLLCIHSPFSGAYELCMHGPFSGSGVK